MQNKMLGSSYWRHFVILAVFLLLAGFGYAQDTSNTQEQNAILEAAKEEGTVVFYSAAPTEVLDQLTDAFSDKYPEINAEYYRSNSSGVFQRLQAELRANNVQADIVHVTDPVLMNEFQEQGALLPYQSPQYEFYPDKYVADDFTWFVARGHLLMIGYNPSLVPESEVPTSWKAFLDPEYQGRVGIMNPRLGGGAYYWQYAVWETLGPDYFEPLAQNEPQVFGGHGPITNRVISGELAVGVTLNYLVDRLETQSESAPLEGVYPIEGSPLLLSPTGIVNEGAHPNAAKLFMDFLASPEGQEIFNSEYTYSLREGATLMPGMTPLSEINVLELNTDKVIAAKDEVKDAILGAFGIQ